MKKVISILLITSMLLLSPSLSVYAEDLDSQIAELEAQISGLQTQLNALKAEKAKKLSGVSQGDQAYVESDRIFETYYNSLGELKYDAIIEITNTSTEPLYLGNCTFDIEDLSGHLIQSDNMIDTCPNVIAPGGKGYFYNQFGCDLDAGVDLSSIQLVPHYNVEKANKTPHEYPLSDLSFTSDEYGSKVVGRVLNDTDEEENLLYIHAMFYNADGKIIGISGVNVDNMMPGVNTSFEISSMLIQNSFNPANVAQCVVMAQEYLYQF